MSGELYEDDEHYLASITLILQVRVEDVKPAGFKRLIHLIYNSRCLSWKMDDPEEWWYVLEAANKYMNIRLVELIERRLRDIARKESGKWQVGLKDRCV